MRTKIYFTTLFAVAITAGILYIKKQEKPTQQAFKYNYQEIKIKKSCSSSNAQSKLYLNGDAEVVLIKGNYFSIEFEGKEFSHGNPYHRIGRDGVYVNTNKFNKRHYRKKRCGQRYSYNYKETPKLYISMPDLEQIIVNGSGDINIKSDYSIPALEVKSSGSSDIKLENLEVESLTTMLHGSGDLELNGKSKKHFVKIFGSGDVDGKNLKASTVRVEAFGSGDVQVFANKDLETRMSGSGNVIVYGNPSNENFNQRNGSGKIIHKR